MLIRNIIKDTLSLQGFRVELIDRSLGGWKTSSYKCFCLLFGNMGTAIALDRGSSTISVFLGNCRQFRGFRC